MQRVCIKSQGLFKETHRERALSHGEQAQPAPSGFKFNSVRCNALWPCSFESGWNDSFDGISQSREEIDRWISRSISRPVSTSLSPIASLPSSSSFQANPSLLNTDRSIFSNFFGKVPISILEVMGHEMSRSY